MNPYSVKLTIMRSPHDVMTAKALKEFGVATLAESQAKRGLCASELRPIQQGACVAGPAITVLCPAGDNLMIHAAIEACQPGDILVVATLAPSSHGAFGELLAEACRARGVVGAVLETGVRDTAALRVMEFPVWSRHVCATGTVKASPGWVNAPVVAGGVVVHPGDFVVADDDGIVLKYRRTVDQV
ncbi:MAG: 4-carboxy-4-hydroxy-2-oxoadipate aldolase/oxaloacetate decarboxylase, partial [Sulfobacillus sp.]